MSARPDEPPLPEPRSRLDKVLAAGVAFGAYRVAQPEEDDRELSRIVEARASRWLQNAQDATCGRDVQGGDLLVACAPPQDRLTSNDTFYSYSYDATSKRPNSTLNDIARAVDGGLVLGTSKEAVLRTLSANTPLVLRRWWNKFLYKLPLRAVGSGSFNKAYKSNSAMPYKFWKLVRPLDPKPWDYHTGHIVIRQGEKDPNGDPDALKPIEVVQEMYLTGYASHYKLGPTLLCTYYLRDVADLQLATQNSRSLDELLAARLDLSREDVRKLVPDHPQALRTNKQVYRYVSCSCAWDGDCATLLQDLEDSTGSTPFSSKYPPAQIPAIYARFAELFVELLVNASAVGFFHGDIKPQNVLYQLKKTSENVVNLSSLKVCLTDFDPTFCSVLPPRDRPESVHCLLVANVCLFLGMVRCWSRSGSMWINLRKAIRPVLQRAMLGVDVGLIANGDDDSLCKFLQDSDVMYSDFGVQVPRGVTTKKADYPSGYDGQKKSVSHAWQFHVAHYMSAAEALRRSAEGKPGAPCIPIDPNQSIYSQVIAYALDESPPERTMRQAQATRRANARATKSFD